MCGGERRCGGVGSSSSSVERKFAGESSDQELKKPKAGATGTHTQRSAAASAVTRQTNGACWRAPNRQNRAAASSAKNGEKAE